MVSPKVPVKSVGSHVVFPFSPIGSFRSPHFEYLRLRQFLYVLQIRRFFLVFRSSGGTLQNVRHLVSELSKIREDKFEKVTKFSIFYSQSAG